MRGVGARWRWPSRTRCPAPRGYAVENSPAALDWLRRNAEGTTVQVVAADVRDPDLLVELRGTVDAVLSNPPYVPVAQQVEPEVRADPAEAVFAGPDGLDLMPDVVARAAQLLRPGGVVAIEHDDTHGESLPRLLTAHSVAGATSPRTATWPGCPAT